MQLVDWPLTLCLQQIKSVSSFSDTPAVGYVKINDVRITKGQGLITDTTYTDAGLPDHLYEYQVTSVDTNGLESPLSPMVQARIGDAGPSP